MRTGNVLQDESKEEKTMEHIEMVEKLMEKANVSYAEAKQALENNNWDMLDALIELERQGKVHGGQGTTRCTTEPEKENKGTRQENPGANKSDHSGWDEFWNGFCRLIRRGMQNHFVAQRRGETVISVPVLLLILLLCIGFWFILPLMIVGLFCECRYSFEGPDLGRKDVNDAMGKATEYADDLKASVKSGMNEDKTRQ
jgi:hypothetical protein